MNTLSMLRDNLRFLRSRRRPHPCPHVPLVRDVVPKSVGCAECVARGDTWVHLRLCLHCGEVGCCNSSTNRHAQKHAEQCQHPIVRSHQPGEDWMWCYMDQRAVTQR